MKIDFTTTEEATLTIAPGDLKVGEAMRFNHSQNILVRLAENVYVKFWKHGGRTTFHTGSGNDMSIGSDHGTLIKNGGRITVELEKIDG